MGISSHDLSSPFIENHPPAEQQPQHEEMETAAHDPWKDQAKRQRPERTRSDTTTEDEDKHHVSFATLSIREYTQVLGDHSCCTFGPPVSLGWDYKELPKISVERYEATRPRRRSRTDLKLSFEARREILSDVSEADVRRVQRRLSRERCCQDKTMKSFFGKATSVSE